MMIFTTAFIKNLDSYVLLEIDLSQIKFLDKIQQVRRVFSRTLCESDPGS